jgi:hypothetical protein
MRQSRSIMLRFRGAEEVILHVPKYAAAILVDPFCEGHGTSVIITIQNTRILVAGIFVAVNEFSYKA